MLRSAAIAWVKANCPNPKLYQDVVRAVDDAAATGYDCFFIFGGKLTKKKTPFLLHCFADELFIFQLTDAQAKARGVKRDVMCSGRNRRAIHGSPDKPIIAIERLDLKETWLQKSQPILGRVHYEVQAEGGGEYAVRLDYAVGPGVRTALDLPNRPLWGKGMLDVSFVPIVLDADTATDFKGPLAVFVTIVEKSPSPDGQAHRPISNSAATLVNIV